MVDSLQWCSLKELKDVFLSKTNLFQKLAIGFISSPPTQADIYLFQYVQSSVTSHGDLSADFVSYTSF